MPTIIDSLKPLAYGAISYALLPLSMCALLLRLARQARTLQRADIVVLPDRKLNFANTVKMPDAVRRLFPDKKCVFMTFREPQHNPYVPLLWTDIAYLSLRRFGIDMRIGASRLVLPLQGIHDPAAASLVRFFVTSVSAGSPVFLRRPDVIAAMPIPDDVDERVKGRYRSNPSDPALWYLAYAGYHHLVNRQPSAPVRLPSHLRDPLWRRVRSVRPDPADPRIRTCALYQRMHPGPESVHRNGSPLEDYLPALHLLVQRGYQVLLAGDRRLPEPVAAEFRGMVVDESCLGVSRAPWLLFAVTEADIYIGEQGGGLMVSVLNEKPRLVLNVFPWFAAIASAWIYYKAGIYEHGERVAFKDISSKFRLIDRPNGFRVAENTPDEILDAVRSFLDYVETGHEDPVARALASLWGTDSVFHIAGARLSSAYVRSQLMMDAAVPSAAQ